MFGYIKPNVSELKVKEYELYKAIYCGLCRALGSSVSKLACLTLSYDFVFLALVRMAIVGETPEISAKRCPVHMLKKRPYVKTNSSLEYTAKVGALLGYYKNRDDIADEHGLERLRALSANPALEHMKRRAVAKEKKDSAIDLAALGDSICGELAKLSELERERCGHADRVAECFGRIMGEMFSYGITDIPGSASERIAYEIGFHCGKWIYLRDAGDDYDSDVKRGAYNPFICAGKAPEAQLLHAALRMELDRMSRAIELIDCGSDMVMELIRNIIYLGMTDYEIKETNK